MTKSKNKIAYWFLFLPLFIHWTLPEGRWETLFTVFNISGFRYSWIVLFYLLFYLKFKGEIYYKNYTYLKRLFLLALIMCPISLISSNEAKYAIPLFFEALPCLLLPIALLKRPLEKTEIQAIKQPFLVVYAIQVFLYFLSTFFGITIISYEFDDIGDFMFYRPVTFVGGPNSSSFFLFLGAAFYAENFISKEKNRIAFLLVIFGMVVAGSCRGALLCMAVYLSSYLLRYFFSARIWSKVLLLIMLGGFAYGSMRLGLFSDVLQRNETQTEIDDISNGRGWRIALVLEQTMRDSPIIGVGHGRVFSTSKDLLSQFNDKNFEYSKYHGAPHNAWVIILAEYGILGAILAIVGAVIIFCCLDYKNRLSYVVIVSMLIFMNTEAIMVQDDFWPLFWIMVNLSRKKVI